MKNKSRHITPVAFPAINTDHVNKDDRGVWQPAPRRAYAVITVRTPIWGYGDRHDEVIGYEYTGTMAVALNAGQSLTDVVGLSSTFGDEIYTAIACTRDDYMEFLAIERAKDAIADALPDVEF